MDETHSAGQRRYPISSRVLLLCAVYLMVAAVVALGQVETTSGISGRVTDPSGALIVGASVTARNENTGELRQTRTNTAGFYSFASISPGTYSVTVSHVGFETETVSHRVIFAAQPAIVDVTLRIGSQTQSVTVSAAGAELITPSSAELATTISPTLVGAVPIVRQNFLDLLTMVPGAAPQNVNVGGLGTSQMAASENYVQAANEYNPSGVFLLGNRDSGVNVSIDGANVQDAQYQGTSELQSPADIQEVKVESGMMNAEFGNGVAAVNVITKSGTNQYHGSVYEYLRNKSFDAADFFTNLLGRKLPNYQQNQYGFTFGGPIKRNKLLFFGNFEGFRLQQSAVAQENVPPVTLRNGDFSAYQVPLAGGSLGSVPTVYNPYQFNAQTGLRQPFPGDQIPLGPTPLCSPRPTCVDPATLAYMQKWILPPNAVVQGVPEYVGVTRTDISSQQETVRLDYLQSDTSTIYGRFTRFADSGFAGGLLPLEGTGNNYPAQSYVAHWTKSFSSNLVNDLMLNFSLPTWFLGRNTNVPNVSAQIGVTNVSGLPGGPAWEGTGFGMGNSGTFIIDGKTSIYQFKDDLNLVRGSHTFKFGFERTERRFYNDVAADDKGVFYFDDYYSSACPLGNRACTSAIGAPAGSTVGGMAFADYLLGATSQPFFENRGLVYFGYQSYYGAYAQDSWRASSKLTVNLGLRYEYWAPWLVPRNTTVGFNFSGAGSVEYALQNPDDYLNSADCYGECAPLNPNFPRQGYTRSNPNLAPRVGLAYQISPNTVVRAGFGTYYDGNVNDDQFFDIQTGAAPFNLRYQEIASGAEETPPYLVSQNFPAIAASPTAIPKANDTPLDALRYVEPYYPLAAEYEWELSLQRRLGRSWAVEANYVGSHTVHEQQFEDMNGAVLPQGQNASLTLQERRRLPGWSTVETWAPIGWAKYEGLVTDVKNTSWHGLTIMSNFTWAKNITTSLWGLSDQSMDSDYLYPYTYAGPFAATPKLRSVTSFQYELPFGSGKALGASLGSVSKAIISGWSISGITTFQSGSPDVVLGPDTTGTGDFTGMNRICNPNSLPGGRSYLEWFNTACFVSAPFGTLPNSPLGATTDPGINDWDISIAKSTPMRIPKESGRILFRADFFNAWNHVQWGDPAYRTPSSVFGRIGSTRPARQIQFMLKYTF